MSTFGTRLGVAIGLIATPLFTLVIIDLLMGDCLFEQGCGRYENFKLVGAFLAACLVGACVGWLAASLFKLIGKRR